MQLTRPQTRSSLVGLAVLAALAIAGCGKSPSPAPEGSASQSTEVAAQQGEASDAAAQQAEAIAAKEQELADREAAVKQQEVEAELARRNAESAQQAADAAAAAAKKSAAQAKAAKAAPPAKVAAAQPQLPPPPPPPIVVPAGTPLAIELVAAVNTKNAAVGNPVQGRLASDLVVGGRLAARAGSAVGGKVTQVASGSNQIGGAPALGITFDSLSTSSGPVAISARLLQQGASETGKDTAKVVGTTAAGAVIGHQVSSKNGAVVGGLIGGATGLAIAKKTGGDVKLTAGTVVNVPLDSAVQINGG
jgi:hypothetical protein